MSNPESSLPEPWVRKIFSTMRATYGAAFDRQWQCPAGTDPAEHAAEMIGYWARELRGYQQSPQNLAYALGHLPNNPPNLIEFKALCRGMPVKALALPPPDFDSEAAQKALAGITKPAAHDPKQWAHDLKRREGRDPRGLSATQRGMWREALGENRGAA